jgi:hypothetical protein
MLSVEEFTSGALSDAKPLALMLSRTTRDQLILVGGTDEKRAAVFVGKQHRFVYFTYDVNHHYSGLIIKHIAIELDECATFDPNAHDGTLGSLVRQGTTLSIYATTDPNSGHLHHVPLIENLEAISERCRVGFLRWQIVIGSGAQKRILQTIDVRPS